MEAGREGSVSEDGRNRKCVYFLALTKRLPLGASFNRISARFVQSWQSPLSSFSLDRVTATTCVSSPHRSSTNTNRRPLMSESYSPPTEPEGIVASLVERFNSGKVSAMMGLYAPEAVFIAKDGRTVTDHTEIAAELERDLSLGLPLEAKARHVFVADDIAQIVLDWSIDGTGPDGKHVHLGGSASDIVRRSADGLWRYLIDNNLGTAVRQPA